VVLVRLKEGFCLSLMKLIFIQKNKDNNNVLELCCILKPSTYLKNAHNHLNYARKRGSGNAQNTKINQILKSGYA